MNGARSIDRHPGSAAEPRRGRPAFVRGAAVIAVLLAVAWVAASCAHAPRAATSGGPRAAPAPADSATVALWRMDESAISSVADSGPLHADGIAGLDTRTAFGRFDGARSFTRSHQSFVYIPYVRGFDIPLGFTIEAWVNPRSFESPADTPIAARWTAEANTQSWILSIIGRDKRPAIAPYTAIGGQRFLIPGQIAFSMLPAQAAQPLVYVSTRGIEIGRWTHVAATYDGAVVRIYLDGQLDAQYAIPGEIRSSPAPILVGNWFDPRALTDFEGRLRVIGTASTPPGYAFDGSIDDLRLSNVARTDFPNAR